MINDPKVDLDDDNLNDFKMDDDDENEDGFNDEMEDDFEDEIDEDQIKEMDGFDANELLEEEGEDDDDDDDLDDDEEDEEKPNKSKKGKKPTSVFASADDFQELLDNSGKKEETGKLKKWSQKQDSLHEDFTPRNKGRGRKRPHGSIKHKGNKKRKTNK